LATNYLDPNLSDDPVQPLYAATLSGAFHPNALGHAALADSVLVQLRKVLKEFDGQ
jgi:lysophospholipase L1-like esterase